MPLAGLQQLRRELEQDAAILCPNRILLTGIDSTNSLARRIIDAYAAEGLAAPEMVLIALGQWAGRGRRGSRWLSAAGLGVYASLTRSLPEEGTLASLPLLVGVGLCRELEELLAGGCRLKWPNDLVTPGGRKLGGILLESLAGPEGRRQAIIGFGVNGNQGPADLPPEGATSLRLELGREVSVPRLAGRLVAAVERELDGWRGTGQTVRAYRRRSVHRPGDRLLCRTPAGAIEGRFEGFTEEGALLLRAADGLHQLAAGVLVDDGEGEPR